MWETETVESPQNTLPVELPPRQQEPVRKQMRNKCAVLCVLCARTLIFCDHKFKAVVGQIQSVPGILPRRPILESDVLIGECGGDRYGRLKPSRVSDADHNGGTLGCSRPRPQPQKAAPHDDGCEH